MPLPSAESPADAARRMIEANSYLTLATADASGRPWATPVWFAHAESEAGYEFVWVSKPGARHSQNVAARPEIAIVVYDSTVPVGGAAAVYVEAVAAEVAAADDHGMRAAATSEAASLGEITEVLARAGTIEELKRALEGVTRLLGAEEAAISRLDAAAGCLITVSDHDWSAEGERWQLDDYPTTAHVVAEQAIGQVIAGDPASDPAELEILALAGMQAVLLMPLVHEGRTIALLEIYRRSPQAWTNTQVDLARVLANHIAPSLVRAMMSELPASSRRQVLSFPVITAHPFTRSARPLPSWQPWTRMSAPSR